MKAGWKVRKLAEIAETRPQKKQVKTLLPDDQPVSFVPMDCLQSGNRDLADHEHRPLGEVYKSYTYFADGDVLVAKITPCFENGKQGVAKGLRNGVGFGSSEFFVIRPNDELDADFLYYFLDQHSVRERGARVMSGAVGHKRVPKEHLEGLAVPLPPLEEQQRIVAILDEAFEKLDRAKANAEANLSSAKELFEGALRDAFANTPLGWTRSPLGRITSKIGSGATPRGGKDAYQQSGLSLIRSLNVHDRDFRFEKLAFIDDTQAEKLRNVVVEADDVLLNITGASVARCCVVPEKVLPARVNQHVAIIRPLKDVLRPDFLCMLLTSHEMKKHLLQTGLEGGATRQAITKKQIETLEVAYPDLTTQDEIVARLAALELRSNQTADKYREKVMATDQLRQSLLAKAFAGELT